MKRLCNQVKVPRMTHAKHPPTVLIAANRLNEYRGTPAHVLRDTYVRCVANIAGCVPFLLPLSDKPFDLHDYAGVIDGILLTGSSSHMDPARYGAERIFDASYLEPQRDTTALSLVSAALEMDIPFLGICRGFQELNIACGGTLYQQLHKTPGKLDHRHNPAQPMMKNYEKRSHKVRTAPGGLFQSWGFPPEFAVNSLHEQGPERLGAGLIPEAIAEDGLVEAASMPGKRFAMGVQWHPEGDAHLFAESRILFERFGQALTRKV